MTPEQQLEACTHAGVDAVHAWAFTTGQFPCPTWEENNTPNRALWSELGLAVIRGASLWTLLNMYDPEVSPNDQPQLTRNIYMLFQDVVLATYRATLPFVGTP